MKLTSEEKRLVLIAVDKYLENPSLSTKQSMQALRHKLTLKPKEKKNEDN